jgi:hypothetical protein
MTVPVQDTQAQEQKISDKELNFRNLEAKYQKELAQERAARQEAERIAHEAKQRQAHDEDDDSEPYVDHRKLEKKLARFGEQTKQQTQSEIKQAVQQAIEEERQNAWLRNNPDFSDVLSHAQKLYEYDPELGDTILKMPENFERQKLVYKNIKALNLHKPAQKQQSIQDKIDANKRSPYFQPSGIGNAGYESVGDFSPVGQKQAYDKMQQLKSKLRI